MLWFVLATILATIAGKVADWIDMTDEFVYERLAISISRYHSLLPRIHGAVITLTQLYPPLIAPIFPDGTVPDDLERPHPRRLGDELRGDPGVPARPPRLRQSVGRLAAGGRLADDPLDDLLAVPRHRDRCLSAVSWTMLAVHRSVAAPAGRTTSSRSS